MSRSYHANLTHLRGYSSKEIDEMAKNPDSILNQIAYKSTAKKTEKAKRKFIKRNPESK